MTLKKTGFSNIESRTFLFIAELFDVSNARFYLP